MRDPASTVPRCEPAEVRSVFEEPAVLPPFSADVWSGRFVPRGILVPFRGQIGTPAPGALDTASLIIRHEGGVLQAGPDYVVDEVFGTVCLPDGGHDAPLHVTLDYRYSLLRIDSQVSRADGGKRVERGVSHLTNPHPPRLDPADTLEANLLVEAFSDGTPELFRPRPGRNAGSYAIAPGGAIPHAARRVAIREPVSVLFLGDSITQGGDASTDESSFPAVAGRAAQARIASPLTVSAAATGGSRSVQWLDPDDPTCDWNRVVDAAPQVTLVEFFNDAYLEPERWEPAYDELVDRLRALGSEVVLLTPTFAMRSAMHGVESLDDGRPYVHFLRQYAARRAIPLIDVSARWERLRDEGLPYWTVLANGINHPDDRGHRLTGEFVADALVALLSGPQVAAEGS